MMSRKSASEKPYGTNHVAGIIFLFGFLWYTINISDSFLPVAKKENAHPLEFSGLRARKHLEAISSIGPRPSGSYANDVLAVETMLNMLNKIKKKANPKFHIEIELQYGSGSFAFVRKNKFIDLGFTSAYNNITNILVKISAEKNEDAFVLANVHYDTVMNTEGASDDTISCAVLIELFRAFTQRDPSSVKNGLILLFNGAEEGGLAGSHLFVDQHRWAKLVKAVVNIEAAGSGGREFVFQTGPEHPWILRSYADSAKYPFASIIAQEIFQSGVIPSDTDFRVFVQYGKMVGIDLAFVSNGYVYHTKYDNAKAIPSGSIQRAGDNILALILKMVNSPYLTHPEDFKHGSTVFYDILGFYVVHYPKRLQMLMNQLTGFTTIVYILMMLIRKQFSSKREHVGLRTSIEHISVVSLTLALLTILLSYVMAALFAGFLAYLLTKSGYILMWYSIPSFNLFLYGFPALVGMMVAHYIGNSIMQRVTYASMVSFIYANLIITTIIVLVMTHYGIASSFMFWFWLVFPLVLLTIPHDIIKFLPEMRDNGIFALHIFAMIPPLCVTLYHMRVLYTFFGALLGRTGTELPPDYVIAGLTTLFICIAFSHFMTIFQRAYNMKQCIWIFTLFSLLSLAYITMFYSQPFSASNGVITPKRMFIQHTHRRFFNSDETLRKEDSGILLLPLDYTDIKPIKQFGMAKDLKELPCEGSYCGIPYYYAMRKIIRKQFMLYGEPPSGREMLVASKLYKRSVTSSGNIRFNFEIKGPSHTMLFLTMRNGAELSDWSMYKSPIDDHIYSMENYVDGNQTHFVFFSRGYYADTWKFWFEIKKPMKADVDLAEIGIARHYLYGDEARTPFLKKFLKQMPDWFCDNSWTSHYDSFVLR